MKAMHDDTVPAIQKKFPGKDIAFTPSLAATGDFWVLSVVVKDEPGHAPLPHQLAWGTAQEMQAHAEDLNDRCLRLTKDQASMYVASSMRGAGRS